MATLSDIQTKVYSLTGTDATSYPNANMLIDLNVWQQKIVTMILDSQDEVDWDDNNQTTYPIFKALMTANRDIQIPVNLRAIRIKDISMSYDGVNVRRGEPFDINETDYPIVDAANTTANANLDAYMSRTTPKYDVKFGSIWLYPMPSASDVASGAYIVAEFFRQAIDFTSSDLTTGTLIPGFDPSFHYMLAFGAAQEYCMAKQLPQLKGPEGINAKITDYEGRLRRQYSSKMFDRRYDLSSDMQSMK